MAFYPIPNPMSTNFPTDYRQVIKDWGLPDSERKWTPEQKIAVGELATAFQERRRWKRSQPRDGSQTQTAIRKRRKTRRRHNARFARFAHYNWFLNEVAASLSDSEKLAWFGLWRYVRGGSYVAETTLRIVARELGLHHNTVYRAVAGLKRRGLVKMIKRGSPNQLSRYLMATKTSWTNGSATKKM